jgi:hypothetical protein
MSALFKKMNTSITMIILIYILVTTIKIIELVFIYFNKTLNLIYDEKSLNKIIKILSVKYLFLVKHEIVQFTIQFLNLLKFKKKIVGIANFIFDVIICFLLYDYS